MNNQIIKESDNIFKGIDQWLAFTVLCNNKNDIVRKWIKKAISEILLSENTIGSKLGWCVYPEADLPSPALIWCPKDQPKQSICVCLEWKLDDERVFFGLFDYRENKNTIELPPETSRILESIFPQNVDSNEWWLHAQKIRPNDFCLDENAENNFDTLIAKMHFNNQEFVKYIEEKIKKLFLHRDLLIELNKSVNS